VSAPWQALADALRNEIFEYGRLLQLFEEQQRLLFARDPLGVWRTSDGITAQVALLEQCRQRRGQASAEFAAAQGRPTDATVQSLLELVTEEARPLLRALVADVNHSVARVRRIARHNRLFLVRTIECHQEWLRRLHPGALTHTYAPSGRLALSPARRQTALVAEG
jgi:flagellar biosynthesis/type III secretory pathway chaperone